jgi:ammonium transporter, Amt family
VFESPNLVNNLWVLLAALFVFTMTIAVGFLEVGELGEDRWRSLLKTTIMTCMALAVMAFVGFNLAFAPTLDGIIGNPFYTGAFLGGSSPTAPALLNGVWWSTNPTNNQGVFLGLSSAPLDLTLGTYFLFETAFAAVTLALVGVIAVKKVKLRAFSLYCVPYFLLIWTIPAAWIWNPSGWLAKMGMVDFAGGLVVHAAAGAAGLGIMVQIWREEKARGLHESPQITTKVDPTWTTLAILLLWVGWFGFNPGSVLAFNSETTVVALTTFLAAAVSFLSLMFCRFLQLGNKDPGYLYSANGVLMGLIVITPLAGFVSPLSAVVLGVMCGPLFLAGERFFARFKWFSDPIGLMPGHLLGGLFGVVMIGFFAQSEFATPAGAPSLPSGLLFGGGMNAVHQLGVECLGIICVMAVVLVLSFLSIWVIAKGLGGITSHYYPEPPAASDDAEPA